MKTLLLIATLLVFSGCPQNKPDPLPTPEPQVSVSPLPNPVAGLRYGVTVDNTTNLAGVVAALRSFSVRPMVRVVFDPGMNPSDYMDAVVQISAVADVVGQPVDSEGVKKLSASQYAARMAAYADAFKGKVIALESGNEINGDWLGASSDVAAKISAGYDAVKARGIPVMTTVYYNNTCEDAHGPMFDWIQTYVADRVKQGTDLATISYYSQDCNGREPALPEWQQTFDRLASIFPNAKVGFGEIGLKSGTTQQLSDYARQYVTLQVNNPRYFGGFFYWYFNEQAVGSNKPFLGALTALFR